MIGKGGAFLINTHSILTMRAEMKFLAKIVINNYARYSQKRIFSIRSQSPEDYANTVCTPT